MDGGAAGCTCLALFSSASSWLFCDSCPPLTALQASYLCLLQCLPELRRRGFLGGQPAQHQPLLLCQRPGPVGRRGRQVGGTAAVCLGGLERGSSCHESWQEDSLAGNPKDALTYIMPARPSAPLHVAACCSDVSVSREIAKSLTLLFGGIDLDPSGGWLLSAANLIPQ